jgi:hypothetical protein
LKYLNRICAAIFLPGTLCILIIFSGGVASASTIRGWNVIPSANVKGAAHALLDGVSADAANDAWAVGSWFSNPSLPNDALIEHWNGSAWKIVPGAPISIAGASIALNAVAALKPSDVWAVGTITTTPTTFSVFQALVEHWDGKKWSRVVSTFSQEVLLQGVSALSDNDVWVVGVGDGLPFAAHWNGKTWTQFPIPGSFGGAGGTFYAVHAISASNVWVVGTGNEQTLIEHWNGAHWNLIPSPVVGQTQNLGPSAVLSSITAASAKDLWAVGNYSPDGFTNVALIEHWNGAHWSVVSSPPTAMDGVNYNLVGVAAVAANNIWAIGYNNIEGLLFVHWNGTAWSLVKGPAMSASEYLDGISVASPCAIWAVGEDTSGKTLTEFYS